MATPEMSISLHNTHLPQGSYEVTVTNSEGTRVFHNKIKVSSQAALETGVTVPQAIQSTPATFPQFKKLPSELRNMIWEYSIQNDSGVFFPTGYDLYLEVAFSHKIPAFRQGLWFGIFSDIKYDPEVFNYESLYCDDGDNYYDLLRAARKVAVGWYPEITARGLLGTVVSAYPHCQTLFLVLGRKATPDGNVIFYNIPGDDLVWWSMNNDEKQQTWEQMRNHITKEWHEEELLHKLYIEKAKLPNIQTVEVFPRKKSD
ncbi:hypothetical protein F53441_2526 [Fusarium austroafricanum]|uniref:2EXR domain-containing protein n=1 Tax=Fusarium austroafricanum TaxID=2364996 RepID=A0A8H4PBV3_9HYPO|nr:hypothetical protein F53441_2526 [Fusarium austroafricanum]